AAVATPLLGRIGDLRGRRATFLAVLLVVALGRLQGARIGYVEALRVVGTAHLLTPYPFAVAALLCIIPGMYGGTLAAIVFAIGGVAATTVSETAIALRVRELSGAPAAGASGVIQAAAFGGATLVVVGVLTYWFGSLLVTAGFQAIFGGLVNTLSTLGGLGGMGGLGGTLG
ncbi:MAG: hypothetical protein J7480_08405, partial [Microbacteriaceae bacterium]|nr:hypothetical protein [Microbacteriaceae bacterium]